MSPQKISQEDPAKRVIKAVRKDAADINSAATDLELALVKFGADSADIDLAFDFHAETVWATYSQMAGLFACSEENVIQHVTAIYADEEVERDSTTKSLPVVRREGKRTVRLRLEHFNLDVILAVGYRVSSARAIKFRQWATRILKAYLTQGYALNEARLSNDPIALQKLAEEVRQLRTEEISYFEAVRDCFKASASDYDKDSPTTRAFFARLQNTFHFAITEKTAAQIILERASFRLPNMGFQSDIPTLAKAKVAKSYLDARELRRLRILSEQFLLFAEERIERGQRPIMQQLLDQLDRLLIAGDYPVHKSGPDYLAKKAEKHAQVEYARWLNRQARGLPDSSSSPETKAS